MKSRILTCITAVTLFAVLALPLQLAAQGQLEQTLRLDRRTRPLPSAMRSTPASRPPLEL